MLSLAAQSFLILLFVFPLMLSGAPLLTVPGGVPAGLNLTVFASGLDFPVGMVALNDGSVIVGTSLPSAGPSFRTYFDGVGQLRRLQDVNGDGVADGAGAVVATLPGSIAALTKAGDTLVVTTVGNQGSNVNVSSIHLLRPGAGGAYAASGQIDFSFAGNYSNIQVVAGPDSSSPGSSYVGPVNRFV